MATNHQAICAEVSDYPTVSADIANICDCANDQDFAQWMLLEKINVQIMFRALLRDSLQD